MAGNFDYDQKKKRYSRLLAGNWQFFCCGGKFSLRLEKKDTLRPEKKRYSRLSDELGCIFLQESSGFLCFPFLWRFFDRNHDSCSVVTFLERHQETCLYGAYIGSYVGFKKELSIWCILQAQASVHLSHDKEDEPQKPLWHYYHNIKQYYR